MFVETRVNDETCERYASENTRQGSEKKNPAVKIRRQSPIEGHVAWNNSRFFFGKIRSARFCIGSIRIWPPSLLAVNSG